MPTTTARSIVSSSQVTLLDVTSVRWGEDELLEYLNHGQREVAIHRPDACSVVASVPLAAGTRQTLPGAATSLLRPVRNMGVNGTTPGRAVRVVSLDLLDAASPDWHTSAPSTEIAHVATDPRAPKTFYVSPPAVAGTQLELIYAAPPADIVGLDDTIKVDDVFATALYDYVCFRAYTKETESQEYAARARAHRELFDAAMNTKAQADAVVGSKPSKN